jgi:type VI secretion system protein ImpI/type VI secretion system protein
MILTLSLLSVPDGSATEKRVLPGAVFSLGRAPASDWVLADPQRHLSKRHCTIAFRNGLWEVADLSTNGTFLNTDPEPIGSGMVRDLRNGDRLRLGSYEIAIIIGSESEDEVLFDAPDVDLFEGPPQPDHTPGIEDAFLPRQPVVLLSDDWDFPDQAPSPDAAANGAANGPSANAIDPHPVQPEPADLMAAFLRGAGLDDVRPPDPVIAMEQLGTAFRSLVAGLRETLMARAAIKSEFRIDQTMIRSHGNNPLKFSANGDDALLALIGIGRRSDIGPAEAVAESFRDLRLHELATMAAMQTAMRAILRELAPDRMRDGPAQGLLASQRKARAWDAFETAHARMTQALSDNFDSAFGRAFARAYEQALRETKP